MIFFNPPVGKTKFHELVNRGLVVKFKELRGFYLLNESLRRLGLREVPRLPEDVPKRSGEDILRLAFTLIDPLLFPAPPWMLVVETLDLKDADHARLKADMHREAVDALGNMVEKLAYFSGVLDALAVEEADAKSGGE